MKAICVHPTTVPVDDRSDGRYKYEICDLYVDKTMYFIKIGMVGDFALAIDQALLTLERLEFNNHTILPTKEKVEVKNFCLLLVFKNRSNPIETWENIFSFNFLIHLTELNRQSSQRGITIHVDFVYK